MFGDDYKKAMDEIKANEEVKQKVLGKLSVDNKKKKIISAAKFFKSAAALAACCAIVLSVWTVVEHKKNGNINIASEESVTSTVSENSGKETASKTQSATSAKKEVTGQKSSYNKIYAAVKKTYDNYKDVYLQYGKAEAMGGSYGSADKSKGSATLDSFGSDAEDVKTEAPTANKKPGSAQSETVNQVDGVEEADIVKTDGEYLYCMWSNKGLLKIAKVGKNAKFIGNYAIAQKKFTFIDDMYLVGDKLVLMGQESTDNTKTKAIILNVSNPEKPKKLFECVQSGYYKDSRVIGDKLYLISNYNLRGNKVVSKKPETYVPVVDCKNFDGAVSADSIFINDSCTKLEYTLICGFSVSDGTLKGTQSFFGGTQTVYCSRNNIITAGYDKDYNTQITRCSIKDGEIKFAAEGKIKGELLNQFSIDEYKGYFRFVTTENNLVTKQYETAGGSKVSSETFEESNSLVILKPDLKQKSAIRNIAPDERVYSVRFMGDIAYFVTFRETDPLFSVDLSDPAKPKVIGALKIPGFSNYLFPFGDGKLLGVGKGAKDGSTSTSNLKLSMFDISNPANVTESSKTVLDEYYSSALDTHKATFINSKKKLIGLSVYDYNMGSRYIVYKYQNGKFVKKADIRLSDDIYYRAPARGLNIDDDLYIYAGEKLFVYDTSAFREKKVIALR